MKAMQLTAQRVREVLDYDPLTGVFTWKLRRGRAAAGSVAGRLSAGYRNLQVDGVRCLAHRLAWLVSHGAWPAGEIDHINGNPSDNSLANLRDVPHAINQQNRRRSAVTSKTGVLGVHQTNDRRFVAQIRIRGVSRQKYLGSFKTLEEAKVAYLDAKRQLHAGCTL